MSLEIVLILAGLLGLWLGGFFCGWAYSVRRRVNARYRIKASLPEVNQTLPMPPRRVRSKDEDPLGHLPKPLLDPLGIPESSYNPRQITVCGPAPVSQAVPRPPKREKK